MECTYTIKNVNDKPLNFDYLMREAEKRKEICFLNAFSKEEIEKICKHYIALTKLAYLMGYEWENYTFIKVAFNELRIEFKKENKNHWFLRYVKWESNDPIQVKAKVVDEDILWHEGIFNLTDNLNLDLSWAYRSLIEAIGLKVWEEIN